MRILVTGASGLLGKTLCPLLDQEGWQYWACNSKIFDITNTKMVNEIMNKISLDFIIHLAGYTNIDQAEDNPELAYSVNQIGTRNIANIARKHDIPILYVSTDNVGANKFYRKCQFVEEGVFRKHMSIKGSLSDIRWYSVLKDEFK